MLLSPKEAAMVRRGYPPEFRRRVVDVVEAGRKDVDVARDLGISDQTIGMGMITSTGPTGTLRWPLTQD
jgi:transposase-like protein